MKGTLYPNIFPLEPCHVHVQRAEVPWSHDMKNKVVRRKEGEKKKDRKKLAEINFLSCKRISVYIGIHTLPKEKFIVYSVNLFF